MRDIAMQKRVYQQNICKDVASKFEKPWKHNKNEYYPPYFVHSFIELDISELMVSDKSVQDILYKFYFISTVQLFFYELDFIRKQSSDDGVILELASDERLLEAQSILE